MSRYTTNLVSLGNDNNNGYIHYDWMLNADLMRVIKKNPKLEIIDLRWTTISHVVLRQLLLCENLRFLRFSGVGLWSTTAEDVERDKAAVIEKVGKVFMGPEWGPDFDRKYQEYKSLTWAEALGDAGNQKGKLF